MTHNASGLTEKQRATLRAKLESEKARLLARVHLETEVDQPEVGDVMDQAGDVSAHEDAAARTTRDSSRLSEIDHALAKFDRGEYGLSEASGEPIGYGRLEAIPWTRLTVQEEEIAER